MGVARLPDAPPAPVDVRPVRRRTVVTAEGTRQVRHLVSCADAGGSSPLEECATCARCLAMPVDPDAPSAEVVCRATKPTPRTTAAALDLVELALRTPVGAVVRRDVVAIEADAKLAVARDLARGAGPSVFPLVVVDAGARPLGYLPASALVGGPGGTDPERTTAFEVRIPFAGAVRDETALVHTLAALAEEGDAALPVVDDDGALLAVLTATDVVRWLARRAGYEL